MDRHLAQEVQQDITMETAKGRSRGGTIALYLYMFMFIFMYIFKIVYIYICIYVFICIYIYICFFRYVCRYHIDRFIRFCTSTVSWSCLEYCLMIIIASLCLQEHLKRFDVRCDVEVI